MFAQRYIRADEESNALVREELNAALAVVRDLREVLLPAAQSRTRPAERAAAQISTVLSSIPVEAMTGATASLSLPPSVANSF